VVGTKLGTAELSVLEGCRDGNKPTSAARFFVFCIFCFLDRPVTRSERAENFDSV
jgi:hypothetical protein